MSFPQSEFYQKVLRLVVIRLAVVFLAVLGGLGLGETQVAAQGDIYEQAPIHYSKTKPQDPMAKLYARMKSREVVLDASSEKKWLQSLLTHLKVPIESQVLVYSKTSLQIDRISPWRPRALYFSDNVYVGWVQGGTIEIIAEDPMIGPVFYLLGPAGAKEEGKKLPLPKLERSRECLTCHGGSRTNNMPGMLVRSVRADARGLPILSTGTYQTDQSSPLTQRWGGWYVTGENAGPRHMGNLIYEKEKDGSARVVKDLGVDLKSLKELFNTAPYLSDQSDIVALMVMEHQIQVHNALTQARLTARRILHSNATLARHWGEDPGTLTESTKGILDRQAENVLQAMMFCGEFRMEDWGVEGGEKFSKAFTKNSRRNAEGRSLKDLWLVSRLFTHRLSYMIYSQAFDYLPPEVKTRFYTRLLRVLQGEGDQKIYGHLRKRERERILSILVETKKGLPDDWPRVLPKSKK